MSNLKSWWENSALKSTADQFVEDQKSKYLNNQEKSSYSSFDKINDQPSKKKKVIEGEILPDQPKKEESNKTIIIVVLFAVGFYLLKKFKFI